MAEIVDLLFIFWLVATIGVYIIGSIYENHLKEKKKAETKRQKKSEAQSRADNWNLSSYGHLTNYNDTSRDRSQLNSSQFNGLTQSRNLQHEQEHYSYNNNNFNGSSRFIESSFGYSDLSQYPHSNEIRHTDVNQIDTKSNQSLRKHPNSPYEFQESFGTKQTSLSDDVIPTATGFNADCVDWVNQILYLFYSQANKYGPIISENIYRSLNEKLSNIVSSSIEFSDLTVEFRSIDLGLSSKPELKNIRTESETDKSVSAVCKIYNRRLVLDLVIQRTRMSSVRGFNMTSDSLQDDSFLNYELTLENVEGKLKSVAMFNDRLIVVQFIEKPDTKILLRLKNNPSTGSRQMMSEDALVSLILQALTQVVVDLYFGDEPEFPRFIKNHHSGYKNRFNLLKGSASEIKRQIKQDFFGALGSMDNRERKILVKLLRAKNINYNQNVTCILELDNPRQNAISSTKLGSNPFWDEHFLFTINNKTSNELTLELWDSLDQTILMKQQDLATGNSKKNTKSGQKFNKNELTATGKFLGLARVNVDELRKNPVQKKSLMLQSRSDNDFAPNMIGGMDLSDSIGGELQVELIFLEHSNQGVQKSSSATSMGSNTDQGDVVSVDRKLTPSGFLITTTTITKADNQKALVRQSSKDRLSPGLRSQSPTSMTTELSGLEMSLDGASAQLSNRSDPQQANYGADENETRVDSRASRSRSRSRGILRAIRRRFSFSRNRRSRSASESANYPRTGSQLALGQQNPDAISVDSRSRASSVVSASGRAKSVPASRDSHEVPTIVINRGRLSDAPSAFTFTHPKSQLVIECTEPKLSIDGASKDRTLLRHYAIPDDPASERKWRRRGLKLHLFNEHQFVACHLAGSSTCHLCGRVFSRRPGKQGYRCRNCHLLSHKQCHVKVDHNCPYATKDGLKLEFIDADPPASLLLEKGHSTSSLSRQQQTGRTNPRLGQKSISMEVDDR